MNVSPEKMLSAFRSTAEVRIHELATASDGLLSGVEHLTALNLNTGRALLDETIAFTQAAAAAREPRTLVELQIGSITPVLRHGHAWFTTAARSPPRPRPTRCACSRPACRNGCRV
jgi:hypothetical protein